MAQVATPKQLPMQLRPQNHPYNAHTHRLSMELIRNHRQNMVPLATALKQQAAACKKRVSNHGRIRRGAAADAADAHHNTAAGEAGIDQGLRRPLKRAVARAAPKRS